MTINLSQGNLAENQVADYHHFFSEMRQSKTLLTTSQPAVGHFAATFRELSDDGSIIIAVLISEKLSGTVHSARCAAAMLPDRDITVIDSLFTAAALQCFVVEAARLAEAGRSKTDILDHLQYLRGHTELFFLVESLEHLRRGGRIGGAAALVGTILHVKPILHLAEGSIQLLAKVRTWDKGAARIQLEISQWLEKKPPDTVSINFLHVDNPAGMEQFQAHLAKDMPAYSSQGYPIGPVIGSHVGPGCIGVALSQLKP